MNLDWTPCSQPPSDCRRVLVWHRVRPWCRFFAPVVGWWNSKQWRCDYRRCPGDTQDHGLIYQPMFWKDIEQPQ